MSCKTTNMPQPGLRVLELYSGIGGMHWALKESGVLYDVIMAVDINTSANQIYQHNFPDVDLQSFGLEKLSLKKLTSLSCNAILMSPPCQPFTRVGKKADCDDVRTKSFLHILQLIRGLDTKPEYILVENVKGFEISRTRELLVEMLRDCRYSFQEFLLNPLQFGIPNSRLRYYLTARLTPWPQTFTPSEQILLSIPDTSSNSTDQSCNFENNSKTMNSCYDSQPELPDPSDTQSSLENKRTDSQSQVNVKSSNNVSYHEDPPEKNVALSLSTMNCKSYSYSEKHSCNDDDDELNTCRNYKRLKSTSSNGDHEEDLGNTSEKQLTLPLKHDKDMNMKLTDLMDAGRNMRYCEENDAFITSDSQPLSNYMESGNEKDFKAYLLPDKNLFLFLVMDIVLPVLRKSTCFTKRYGHYIEGAGSVVQMSSNVEETKAASALKSRTVNLKNKHEWGEQELSIVRKLKLRYFTPREVANLLCFTSEFAFPEGFNNVQKYRVLGNSLNVHVVSELIKFMVVFQ